MAIPFRNLQGGNPYQGLANTMESVSSRVGATFMSYAQAKRQRDEERARLKAEKEKSMVDAIVKLVPAAVGYEQQKDAFEYKKEQDKEMLGLRKDSLKLDREKLTNQKEYQRLMAGKEDKRFSLLEQQGKEQDRDRERSYLLQESKIQAEKEQNAKILDIKEKTLAHTQKLKELGAQEALERSKINALKEQNLRESAPWKQKESAIELADKITKSRMERKIDLYGLYTDIFGTADSVNSLRDPETGEAEMSFSVWATTPTEMGGYGMTLKEFGEPSSPYTYLDVYNEMGIELTDQNAVKDDSQMSSVVQELTNEVANLEKDSEENTPIVGSEEELSVLKNPPKVETLDSQNLNKSVLENMKNLSTDSIVEAYPEANKTQRGYFNQILTERGVELPNVEEEVVDEEEIEGTKMMVNTPVLNVREGPSTKNKKSGSMLSGVNVIVLETRGGWSRIKPVINPQKFGQLSASGSDVKEEWVWSKSLIPIK